MRIPPLHLGLVFASLAAAPVPASAQQEQAGHNAPAKGATGFSISGIDLVTRGVVPGVSAEVFRKMAEETKVNCIVSRALASVPMQLDAQLVTG